MPGRLFRFGLHATLAGFSWWFYHVRYYEWRDCFNELGRCFDPDGSGEVYTDAAGIWVVPAVIFSFLAAWHLARLVLRRTRSHRAA